VPLIKTSCHREAKVGIKQNGAWWRTVAQKKNYSMAISGGIFMLTVSAP
jgi:hypothetical protein